MKMKEFGPAEGRVPGTPFRSANVYRAKIKMIQKELLLLYDKGHIQNVHDVGVTSCTQTSSLGPMQCA